MTPRTLFLFLVLTAWSAEAADTVSQWQSDFGPVTLSVLPNGSVIGNYPNYQGTLEGQLKGNLLDLYWYQPSSEMRCSQTRKGQAYWGRVTWTVKAEGQLQGKWSYCDQPPGSGGAWNAKQSGGAPLLVTQGGRGKGGSQEVGRDEVWGEVRTQWGSMVHRDTVRMMAVDVTCDDVLDQVAARVNLDHPDGPFYDLLVVTHPAGGLLSAPISIHQSNLCGDLARQVPSFSVRQFSPQEAREMVGSGSCPTALKIDSGECDALYFFWNPQSRSEDDRFLLFQN